ncbi:MAG: secretion protein [bacterium]
MNQLSHGVRVVLVLSAVLVGVACQTRVQHGLREREANRIVAALRKAGVEADKVREKGRRGTFAVEVPRGQVTRSIALLLKHELPRRRTPGFGEVFGKASLVPTALEQRARFLLALSGELTRTLEAASGVVEARVHVVVPERHPLALKQERTQQPRAAVFLRVRPGSSAITAEEVRRLVAGSVQDLAPANVAVVIHQTRPQQASGGVGLAHVGPVSVTVESKTTLLALLGGGLILILLLSAALVVVGLRLGRAAVPSEPSLE